MRLQNFAGYGILYMKRNQNLHNQVYPEVRMNYTVSCGIHRVTAHSYSVEVSGSKIAFVLSGVKTAELDVRSSVSFLADGMEIADKEPTAPELVSAVDTGKAVEFTWESSSSNFIGKTYTLTCSPSRAVYKMKLTGKGRLCTVNYFSGDLSADGAGSDYDFQRGFYPDLSYNEEESCYFPACRSFLRKPILTVPPMMLYSFETSGISARTVFALAAKPGEHNFHKLDYECTPNHNYKSRFYFSVAYDGHTGLSGEWESPEMLIYSAEDDFEAMDKYSAYYFASGSAKRHKQEARPRFWYGPMACGWLEQVGASYGEKGGSPSDYSSEAMYRKILSVLDKHDMHPTVLVLDDKWQTAYGTNVANAERYPDMRAFVDENRKRGIHTMLWFKMFDAEGLPDEMKIKDADGETSVDPSHPGYKKIVAETMHRLLSSDTGCYDCDGLKLDFGFMSPAGRDFTTYSGEYGIELMHSMMKLIRDEAKKVKPQAIINCSSCHPYFADICDQVRLHDLSPRCRDNYEEMKMRARIFTAANPDSLVDTDNSGFSSPRDSMRYQLNQHMIGVPDLYMFTGNPAMTLTDQDLDAISAQWKEYSAMIDTMYE